MGMNMNDEASMVSNGEKKDVLYMDDLIIDYSLLVSNCSSELEKFKSALSSWGCLQLINHGIESSLLDDLRDASKQFITLPTEEKQKYALPKGEYNGYDCQYTSFSENPQLIDWNEGIALTVYPEDRRKLQFWPQNPSNFKPLLHEFTTKVAPMFEKLLKMILRSLNVDEEKFEKQYGKNKEINARVNHYPIFPDSSHGLGLKPHADFSSMTFILQDEEGLEVLKDDKWFLVPAIPHAFFLLLGDPTEIMSNGILKSAVHRAITNKEKSRVSIAMFWDSDRNGNIGPLDELVTSTRPQQYETVSLQNYTTKFLEHYASGQQRVIEAVRIHNKS